MRTGVCKPPAHFSSLFVSQMQFAAELLFHHLNNMNNVSLPLRRPCQYAVQDFFDVVLGHRLSARHTSAGSRMGCFAGAGSFKPRMRRALS